MPPRLVSESDIPPGVEKSDLITGALTELFFIDHPSVRKTDTEAQSQLARYLAASSEKGVWAYYESKNVALRMPSEDMYFTLRTARNRNLISTEEQARYRAARVGIAGLSVGSTAFHMLVATGGPKYMKIADFDTIEISNLNRIRCNLLDVGSNKADIIARDAWELDPFLELEVWSKGIAPDSLPHFIAEPRLDVFIDEMDDIALKIRARYVCKEAKVPVVMATDNGDSVIMDIERFDLEPERPIFHGRVEINEKEVANMTRDRFIALSNRIIDSTLFTPRQWESIQEIGKTLSGVPQLGSAAAIAGSAVAYATRQIVIGAPMPSGRYTMGCESAFEAPIAM